jgi:hypothetical protein
MWAMMMCFQTKARAQDKYPFKVKRAATVMHRYDIHNTFVATLSISNRIQAQMLQTVPAQTARAHYMTAATLSSE